MKTEVIFGILFTLLSRRRVSARYFAKKYDISVRTVYRYVDDITISGIPIDVTRGQHGGISIPDSFKLPTGFLTASEYDEALGAMLAMQEQKPDDALLSAIEKISAQRKENKKDLSISGNILVDSGSWGDTHKFSDKLSLVDNAIDEKQTLFIDYVSREGEHSQRKIKPHLLVYKQNVWYVYAYCMQREAFRLFKLGRIRSIIQTGETFERIPFKKDDVPLRFWHDETDTIEARFEISPSALPFAEEWLGIENIIHKNGICQADVTLPNDESLVGKILSMGGGLKVLSPQTLVDRVKDALEQATKNYA